jgi:hypothetical protein
MANKTLNTRQKQVFRALAQKPLAAPGPAREKRARHGAPAPKPATPKA